jgi:hypothetical protein
MRCARCAYNLRGLALDGRCPECGAPIARSVHGNLLRYADPDWLDKVRFGTTLKLWNLLIMVVLAITVGAGVYLGISRGILPIAQLIGGCLGLWALFLVTSPEPTVGADEDPITLRKVVRTAAVFGFFGEQLKEAAQLGDLPVAVIVGASVLALVSLVAAFGEFVYFRRFARRIPNEGLARSTTIVMWGFVISGGLVATVGGVAAATVFVSGAAPAPRGATAAAAVSIGLSVCVLVMVFFGFGIWYIVLLFRYHSAFKTAAAQARHMDVEQTGSQTRTGDEAASTV